MKKIVLRVHIPQECPGGLFIAIRLFPYSPLEALHVMCMWDCTMLLLRHVHAHAECESSSFSCLALIVRVLGFSAP